VLLVVAPLLLILFAPPSRADRKLTQFESQARRIVIEEYASPATPANAPVIVLLSGSGGVESTNMPYAAQARRFADQGYRVYLPHYLDVTKGSPRDPIKHYAIWAKTVRDALNYIQSQTQIAAHRTALVGYSLGASVALAAAAGGPRLAGVVVWSGGLPDEYVSQFDQLPPLLILHGAQDKIMPVFNAQQLAELCELKHANCKLNIYPGEGHAFSSKGIADANQQVETFLETVLPVE
jgi:dienelactone hydrolase